jgi:hypothetical protein
MFSSPFCAPVALHKLLDDNVDAIQRQGAKLHDLHEIGQGAEDAACEVTSFDEHEEQLA